jgi:hypothetical protein
MADDDAEIEKVKVTRVEYAFGKCRCSNQFVKFGNWETCVKKKLKKCMRVKCEVDEIS